MWAGAEPERPEEGVRTPGARVTHIVSFGTWVLGTKLGLNALNY